MYASVLDICILNDFSSFLSSFLVSFKSAGHPSFIVMRYAISKESYTTGTGSYVHAYTVELDGTVEVAGLRA